MIQICYLFLVFAKEKGYFKEGLTLIEGLRNLPMINSEDKIRIQIIDAQLAWLMDNKLIAQHILNKLCKSEDINPK